MSSAALWLKLQSNLLTLSVAQQGEIGYLERRGLARQAAECARELRMRGTQLTMDSPTDSR